MKVNIIVACDLNGVIGVNGKIPWNIPEDLKRFKELTMGHALIMGRKTWESLPIQPLSGRVNIVVSNTKDCSPAVTCISLSQAIAYASKVGFKEAFVIGGSRMYEESQAVADTIYLTVTPIMVDIKEGQEVARIGVLRLKEWVFSESHYLSDHGFFVLNRRVPVEHTLTEEKP